MALKALVSVLFVSSASSQNDFLRKKYSVVNNITTIDLNNCEDVEYVLSPSLVKSAQNPLFGQDKPWEVRIDNGYPNVVYTPNSGNKTWQLWYSNFIETSPRLDGTLYAQSSDGIEWTKPNLGLVSFENSLENNIVLAPTGGIGIFKDIYTANDAERFKAFGKFEICGGTAVSPDGLNWSGYRCLDLHNQFGTHNNVCACIADKYFATTRGYMSTRAIAVSESITNDFDGDFTKADIVSSGGSDNQTYAQITFEYYNIFLGLLMVYDSTSSDQEVYCELSWSPNMYDWYRVLPGEQLIPLSPLEPVQFDSYICFAAAYPVVVDNMVRLYYFGGNGPHYGERNSSFAMATIRMDGFAGIRNKNGQSGIVNTFKLVVDGKYLCVTVDIEANSSDGSVKVGLVGKTGFEISNAQAIDQNVTDFAVSWNNGNDFSSMMGQTVEIKFELNEAILYTFHFCDGSL